MIVLCSRFLLHSNGKRHVAIDEQSARLSEQEIKVSYRSIPGALPIGLSRTLCAALCAVLCKARGIAPRKGLYKVPGRAGEFTVGGSIASVCFLLCCVLLPTAVIADNSDTSRPPANELEIARLIFNTNAFSGWGPGRPWWAIDWPDAEEHFTAGVLRFTNIDVARDSRHIQLTDQALFDFPWLFVQQVGRWHINNNEKRQLREYLLRGGFMVVDDFHGPRQWDTFATVLAEVLPEYRIVDIPSGDELLHVLFDLEQRTQIPGRRHLYSNGQNIIVQMPHSPPRWRGIYDDDGRLMVAINFNMDVGDAWEHADDPVYPFSMTTLAYQFGINYLIYAMTH